MAELPESPQAVAFERERRRLQRLARALLHGEHDAEDAVQEAWLKLLRAEGEPIRSRQAWLTATVQRIASSRRREAARRQRREGSASRPEPEPGAAQVAERIEVLRRVLDAVEALAEPYRGTIVQRFLEDLPPRAIAKREDVPVNTVRTRVRRGLALLRSELDGEDEGARARFLGLLAPLAGRAPWELGPLVLDGGGIVVKQKIGMAVAGFVGLVLVGGLGWLALRPGEREAAPPEATVQPTAPEAAVAAVPSALDDDGDARREAAVAPVGDWVVRGLTTLAEHELLPNAPLILRLHAGLSSEGEVIAEGRVRSDDAGAFEWAAPTPMESVTLRIEAADPDAYTSFSQLVVPEGDAAPRDLGVHIYPLDLTLVGRVVDEAGEPLAGARVFCFQHGETRSASDGGFRLGVSSRATKAQCHVVHPGFASAHFTVAPSDAGEELVGDIVLRRSRHLNLRLIDELGAPVAGAQISSGWSRGPSTTSDAAGQCVIDWLKEGAEYPKLYARAPGYSEQSRTLTPGVLGRGELEWVLLKGVPVSGRVMDAHGAPVPGARILAFKDKRKCGEAWSDAEGEYQLEPLATGETFLQAWRTGYRPAERTIVVRPEDQAITELDLAMERGHFLAGHVLDDAGEPIPWVDVYYERARSNKWVPHTETDALGRFRIEGLPTASGRLEFDKRGFTPLEKFFPEFDLVEQVVHLTRTGSLAGRVIDGLTGEPLESFHICLVAPSRLEAEESRLVRFFAGWFGTGTGMPFVDTDGYWSTAGTGELELGKLTAVEARAEGYAPTILDRLVVQPDPDPDAYLFELFEDGARVEGRVVDEESGAPVEGAQVQTLRAWMHSAPPGEETVTDADGRFEMEGLARGTTSLVVEHPEWMGVIDGPFELDRREPEFRHIVLGTGAHLVGRLLDPDGVSFADEQVALWAREVEGPTERNFEARTDGEGTFRFEGLRPGEYQLSWKRRFGEMTAAALNRVVVIPPDEQEQVCDLQARGRGIVRGTLDLPGQRTSGVFMFLRPAGGMPETPEGRAESSARTYTCVAIDGRFSFEFVEAGNYRLGGDRRELANPVEVSVPEGGLVEVRLPTDAPR